MEEYNYLRVAARLMPFLLLYILLLLTIWIEEYPDWIFKQFCDNICDSCGTKMSDELKKKIEALQYPTLIFAVTIFLVIFIGICECVHTVMSFRGKWWECNLTGKPYIWFIWLCLYLGYIASYIAMYSSENQPATSENQPATSENQPATSENQPATSEIITELTWQEMVVFAVLMCVCLYMGNNSISPALAIAVTIIIILSYTGFVLSSACGVIPGIECNSEEAQDPDVCNGAGMICKNGKNTPSEECGTCSKENITTETSCVEGGGTWTSEMSSCYWVSPYPTGVTDPPSDIPRCVYDFDKCNCSTFEATNRFNECCPIPDNWKNCSIKAHLEKLEEDLKDEKNTENLHKLYKYKKDASSQCSRREELDLGYYE